jgi:DNA-binding NarL/FixJ family response regulator
VSAWRASHRTADGETGERFVNLQTQFPAVRYAQEKRTGHFVVMNCESHCDRKVQAWKLRSLKSEEVTRNIPVLILTNSSNESVVNEVLELGADGYHLKSNLSLAELGEKVRALLGP